MKEKPTISTKMCKKCITAFQPMMEKLQGIKGGDRYISITFKWDDIFIPTLTEFNGDGLAMYVKVANLTGQHILDEAIEKGYIKKDEKQLSKSVEEKA